MMSVTLPNPSWLHRIRFTPLRDVLRGRISGRLDIQRKFLAADLPVEVSALIGRVVQRTRLWRVEKADVCDELIAHFSDGLASGIAPGELISTFGDEQIAAKLIRRAKKRNRVLRKVMRACLAITAALALFYLVMGIIFITGKPSIRVDYVAEINKPSLALPQDDLVVHCS